MYHERVLEHFGSVVQTEVERFFNSAIDSGRAYHPFIGYAYGLAKEFALRKGKRLASCSTLAAYKGYRGQIDRKIVRVAGGIELYRHCILVHDDIVDKDSIRRGGKTLHKSLKDGYDGRFGACSAIFVGNILYSLSLSAILSSGFEINGLNRTLELMASGFRDVNESQILDLLFEYRSPDTAEWTVMAEKRAASLFRTTILAGALLAGASKSEIELLSDAARHIGYAFDIQDDIIDTFASERQYGRKPCGDLAKGKKPLHVVIVSNKNASLAEMFTEVQKNPKAIRELKKAIRNGGGLKRAKRISRNHAEKAKECIKRSGMNENAKKFFLSLIDYVTRSLEWYK
jgi:geranylgeranyl pyrophosphate synthase